MEVENGGQFVLFAAFPNKKNWTCTMRCFGDLANTFIFSNRVGKLATAHWKMLIDKEQGMCREYIAKII